MDMNMLMVLKVIVSEIALSPYLINVWGMFRLTSSHKGKTTPLMAILSVFCSLIVIVK